VRILADIRPSKSASPPPLIQSGPQDPTHPGKLEKIFITADELLADSFRLAMAIFDDGFRPDVIAGIWRGGTPVGIAIQEYFEYRGVATRHLAIKTASYSGIDERAKSVRVTGLPALADCLDRDLTLLIVDDVFDTGLSVSTVLDELRGTLGTEMPRDARIACPWYKPARNRTRLRPHYFLHETDHWLVFPHELVGLSPAEIRAGKPELAELLKSIEPGR
jgi:hypoxanthine phosphoribosyltransferase